MPKSPLSVTLDDANLLWLKGRAAGCKRRSLSAALDDIVTQARTGGHGGDAPRSVVGTIDMADDDPALERADAAARAWFTGSLSRPFLAREARPAPGGVAAAKKTSGTPRLRG
jgi:hypothetical protein